MLLAVDGGGSKTQVMLATETGEVVCQTQGGPLSFGAVSPEEALANLFATIEQAKVEANYQEGIFSRVLIGMAGVDTPQEVEEAYQIISRVLKPVVRESIEVVNDTVISLAAGSDAEDGIIIISGTGSNCYGKNRLGQSKKAGGLDYVLSDEGSGFYVGQRVLRAAVQSADGREEASVLVDLVKEYFDIAEMSELKERVYNEHFNKTAIAQLSHLASRALEKNDAVARKILDDATHELIKMVYAVGLPLGFEYSPFDLVMVGSMFSNNVIDNEEFKRKVKEKFAEPNFIIPKDPPVYGAIKLLLKQRASETAPPAHP